LVFERFLNLLLFLYEFFFLLPPHLFVKHLLILNYFAPFVRWDFARYICCLFTSLYVQFTSVSSLGSFQSFARTFESVVRKSPWRWLMMKLWYRLQVHHAFPNVRIFLKSPKLLVSVYVSGFDWFKQYTWLFIVQNTQVFNGKSGILQVACDCIIKGLLIVYLAFDLRQVRLILISWIKSSCWGKWHPLPS